MTTRQSLSRSAGPVNYPAVPLENASKGYVDDFYVPASRLVTAGTGLTGGGNLTVDQTLAVTYGTTVTTACIGNDTRLSDARTPLTHTHAESEVTGLVTDLAAKVPTTRTITGTGITGGGDLSANRTLAVTYGTTVATACIGNDTRLSDARTPLTHTHTESDVTNLVTDLAAKVPATRTVTGTSGLTGGGDLAANRTISPTYGSAINTVCQGNDVRLADARTPLTHTHTESEVTNLVTDLAAKVPTSRIVAAGTGLTGGGSLATNTTLTVAYGTTAGTSCQGNDSRLSPLGTAVTVQVVVAGTTTTTSTTFVDLSTTVAVSFVVPPSGKVLVTYSADLWASAVNLHSYVSYRISGTDTRASVFTTGARVYGVNGVRSTAVDLVTGLTAGATNTATLQVAANDGGTASAADKALIVQPVI